MRRTADRLAVVLEGEKITAVELRRKLALEPALARRVLGSRVLAVRTHGKHIVVAFSKGVFLHNHLMMWGKWRVYTRKAWDAGRARPPRRYGEATNPVSDVRLDRRVRLVLATDEHVAVEFNGPLLHFSRTDPALEGSIARLGPDALSEPFDVKEARRRLLGRATTKLADLLLDQTFVAGVGNKYKSELLFLEQLDPFARAGDLATEARERLLRAIPRLLRMGYEEAGRTRPLAEGEKKTDWSKKHWVFRRGGGACWVCGERIATDRRSSARVTFFCPGCQLAASARAAA